MTTAKLFMHGGSQAVRLPREFRFEGGQVFIRRVGQDVVLSARPPADIEGLIAALDEFESGLELSRESVDFDAREGLAAGQAPR